jgi:PAS domain S-box-containing protein
MTLRNRPTRIHPEDGNDPNDERDPLGLKRDIEGLRSRLSEYQDVFRALRAGTVDAIVLPDAEQRPDDPASEAHAYRLLAERCREGVALLGAAGQILFCNAALAALFGLPPEALVNQRILDFVSLDDRADVARLLIRGWHQPQVADTRITTETGEMILVSLEVEACGGLLTLTVTDLTRDKLLEALVHDNKELRAERERLHDELRRLRAHPPQN